MSKATQFLKGARLGMPIALGYIPVSFSFGMLAVQNGIPAWAAIVISMTNLTSAGQFAGMNIISAAGGMWEMAITTFVINLRYMLMSLSLSQKIGKMSLAKRLITAFGITDEVFAVASTTPIAITFPFMNLAAAFGALVGVGASTLGAINLGQKDKESATHVLGNVVMLNGIIGLVFMTVALLFLDPILLFFGASPDTLP